MKKTLAILLALAMVFSTVTVAFAEDAISADAKAAVTLGMLKGDGNGVTAAYTATAPKRIQAAMLFLRLKGLEKAALEFTGTDNFADADQAAWAKPVMAYLKANPTLGFQGVGNNNFDPNGAMTASSYYKVVLTALGYKQSETGVVGDFEWADVLKFAADKGLSKIATVTNFTVNDLAIATIEGLKATVKGSTVTLAAQLIEQKAITEAAAVEAGVYTPAPKTLAVESVKALNLKETLVTFNKEVDEDTAEDTDNYLLDDEDINASIALNADKKSVTITWDANEELENQTEYDLTISGVLDAAGAKLDEVTVTFLANDVTLPVAESIKLMGPNKFKLTFSEPVKTVTADDITVEDKDFDYEVATVTPDGNEVTVVLSDDELTEGNYTVTVTGVTDFADLKVLKKAFTLAYAKDTTAPVAKVTKATQTKVVVEFNKPVYNGDANEAQALTADFFYHTYSTYNPVYVAVSDNNEKYTLYFTEAAAENAGYTPNGNTERALAEGNVKFVVVADGDDNVTDEWGNEMKDNSSFTLAISADTTAPTVTKVETEDQDTINVYFSEDVNIDDATFTVVNKDGDEIDFATPTYSNADDEYVATLVVDPDYLPLEGEYSVTVEDVIDLALEENELSKVTVKVDVKDETAPDLYNDVTVVGVDNDEIGTNGAAATSEVDYIYVTFPEDMATTGTYSVLNKDNYQIRTMVNGRAVYTDLADDDKIATFNGNDKVKITIDDATSYNVANGSTAIVILRVADELGNKPEQFGYYYTINDENSPAITDVEVTGEKTIDITIGAELKAVNKAYITVKHDNNHDGDYADAGETDTLYAIKSWKAEDGETVITGILPAALYADTADDVDFQVIASVGNNFKTIIGTPMTQFTFNDGIYEVDENGDPIVEAVKDGYAPSVKKDANGAYVHYVQDGVFNITFNEELASGNAITFLFAQDLVVKNSDGDVLVAGVDYVTQLASGDNTTIEVIITQNNPETGNYKVYSNDTIKYIRDAAGNKANAFTTVKTIEDLF